MEDLIFQLDTLSKSYTNKRRSVRVIDKQSVSIERKKIYLIDGDSGSGKTTLLTIMAGLRKADEGSIFFWKDSVKHDATKYGDREFARLRNDFISFIPQNREVLPELTVIENMRLADYFSKKKLRRGEPEIILKKLGIYELKDEYPSELSGGELRRLCVARAIYSEPELVIADEPTNDLDSNNRKIIIDIFKELAQKGKAVVIASHDEELKKIADVRFKLENGRISLL